MGDDDVTKVIEREDGFFGVEGMASDTYYADRRTAARVAAALEEARQAEIAQQARK